MDLKRFTFNNKKIHTIVSIDVDKVDLSKYVIGYNKDKCLYQVYAICNHEGSCLGGHYYAYIRTANNKWYKFNDTEVREIPEKQLISDKCYCFFLRKIK